MTSDATRPADLPDWLLAILEGDRQDESSHEMTRIERILMHCSDWTKRLRRGMGERPQWRARAESSSSLGEF